jgi:glycosyltransferase involved in cell wall biosynthesis
LRILFVHAGAELYGADRILLELVAGMIDRGHNAQVVVPGPGPLVGKLEAAGAHVHVRSLGALRRKYLNPRGLLGRAWRIASATVWLMRLAHAQSVDVIHTNTSVVFPGALAAFLGRRPHVWHIHEITTSPRAVWRTLSFVVPRLSTRVVCVSKAVRENLVRGSAANRGKALVIYNGISALVPDHGARERVRAELNIPDDAVLIGMIGRVNRWKGQGVLLDAARILKGRRCSSRFLMVGGTFAGEEPLLAALQEEARASGMHGVVSIQDFRSDVADVLCALDIFVLPSIEPDPFPTVVLEAMLAGLPIVAFAHGGVCEMIEDGVSGTLAAGMDSAALADAIEYYVSDPGLRRTVGERARERALANFSRAAFIGQFQGLYEGLR